MGGSSGTSIVPDHRLCLGTALTEGPQLISERAYSPM